MRPLGEPGVLRVVVPVPGQQHAGLGRPRRLRLPVCLAPAQGPLRPEEPAPSTSTRTRSCCCPTSRCPTCERELEKLGFHRFFETTDSVKHRFSGPQGRSRRHDHRAARPRRRPDRRLRPGGRRRRDNGCFNMNDARPVDLDVAARASSARSTCTCCSTRARSGTRWSTTCRHAPRRRSAPRSGSARWTAAASTSPRSARRGWSRRPARRASSIPSCATSTTTTATRPTSSPTRWCSWTRCARTATTAAC